MHGLAHYFLGTRKPAIVVVFFDGVQEPSPWAHSAHHPLASPGHTPPFPPVLCAGSSQWGSGACWRVQNGDQRLTPFSLPCLPPNPTNRPRDTLFCPCPYRGSRVTTRV